LMILAYGTVDECAHCIEVCAKVFKQFAPQITPHSTITANANVGIVFSV